MKKYITGLLLLLMNSFALSQVTPHPGSLDFDSKDRLAIQNLIHAYAVLWDSGDIENFVPLFTDDAISVRYSSGQKEVSLIKDPSAIKSARERTAFFKKNQMQRRHMMSSTYFLEQTSDSAEVIQYCLLMTTDSTSNIKASAMNALGAVTQSKLVSPIVYNFTFVKRGQHWKIKSREIKLDANLDIP
jgi:hypothetical protein